MTGRSWHPGGSPPFPVTTVVAAVVAGVQLVGCLGAARAAHAPLPLPAVALLLAGPAALATLHRYRLAPMAVALAATAASAEAVLGQRFAEGQIDEREYRERLHVLRSSEPPRRG